MLSETPTHVTIHVVQKKKTSSIFPSISEAEASEILGNIEDNFHHYW